ISWSSSVALVRLQRGRSNRRPSAQSLDRNRNHALLVNGRQRRAGFGPVMAVAGSNLSAETAFRASTPALVLMLPLHAMVPNRVRFEIPLGPTTRRKFPKLDFVIH